MTAAHCLEQFDYIDVNLGFLHSGRNWRRDRKDFYITKENVFIHPNYTSKSNANDIALIRLPEPVEFNAVIHIIHIMKGTETDPYVQYATITTISKMECQSILLQLEQSDSRVIICAENNGHKIKCGDSGGPVI